MINLEIFAFIAEAKHLIIFYPINQDKYSSLRLIVIAYNYTSKFLSEKMTKLYIVIEMDAVEWLLLIEKV